MAYEAMVEKSRRAEKEYYETGDPEKYREKVRNESIDRDEISDFLEDIDTNPVTTPYRYNYPDEMYAPDKRNDDQSILGKEKRKYFPD